MLVITFTAAAGIISPIKKSAIWAKMLYGLSHTVFVGKNYIHIFLKSPFNLQ